MGSFKHKFPFMNKATFRARLVNIVLGVSIGLLLAGGLVSWQINQDEKRLHEMQDAAMHPETAKIGGAFALKDQDGKPVTDADLLGKYMLVYFGYTFCPDMCPTGLQSMVRAADKLGADKDKLNLVFITIDPARDTPAKLKEYVASFGAKILALSGTSEQTAAAAKAYQVYFSKQETEDGPNEYLMDHSTLIYLMDPKGAFVATFPEQVDADILVKAMRDALSGKPVQSVPEDNSAESEED